MGGPRGLTSYYLDKTDRSARTGMLGRSQNESLRRPFGDPQKTSFFEANLPVAERNLSGQGTGSAISSPVASPERRSEGRSVFAMGNRVFVSPLGVVLGD